MKPIFFMIVGAIAIDMIFDISPLAAISIIGILLIYALNDSFG